MSYWNLKYDIRNEKLGRNFEYKVGNIFQNIEKRKKWETEKKIQVISLKVTERETREENIKEITFEKFPILKGYEFID